MPTTEQTLPPGLVLWPPDAAPANRLCVLISDIHCTDCSVGNQTASEAEWKLFFEQMEFAAGHPGEQLDGQGDSPPQQRIDELLLVLNGDIIDLIRSSKWAEAGVYPWDRDDPRFPQVALAILQDIVAIHARERPPDGARPYSGFFHWMRQSLGRLRARGIAVTVVPIVGNHDKELQVLPQARRIFYEECLGLRAADIPQRYRNWVAAQLGTEPDDPYPCLPFYFADAGLRLFATHGQWRDADNARATRGWRPRDGWAPAQWRQERYLPFSEPCFGDTVAAGMLSHFIWRTANGIDRAIPGAERLCRLLDEMDLYRPSVAAVVRLLTESRRLARRTPRARPLYRQVLRCFRDSLHVWLGHRATWDSAWGSTRVALWGLSILVRPGWYWLDVTLMRLMAKAQEPEASIATSTLLELPGFQPACRMQGFRLHVEGHTHVALQADLQFRKPRLARNSYTYVNLGAWRDAILEKRNRGYRRRGVGRALFVVDLARQATGQGHAPDDAYRFYLRDVTSWGDRLDAW